MGQASVEYSPSRELTASAPSSHSVLGTPPLQEFSASLSQPVPSLNIYLRPGYIRGISNPSPGQVRGVPDPSCSSTAASLTLGTEDSASEDDGDESTTVVPPENLLAPGIVPNIVKVIPAKSPTILDPKAAWEKMVKGNRDANNGSKLHLVDVPQNEDTVVFDEEDFDDLHATWGHLLVGYFAGKYPGGPALQKLCRSWRVKYRFSVHSSGWIIFKFESAEDKFKVISKGPHFVYSTALLLKDIPKCFSFDSQEICVVPLWVRLPSLPLELWNPSALSKILSRVGKPIATDLLTRKRNQTNFARALVEIDVSKDPMHEIRLDIGKAEPIVQKILYEKFPSFCTKCRRVGHSDSECEDHSTSTKRRVKGKPVHSYIATPPPSPRPKPGNDKECQATLSVGRPSELQTGADKGGNFCILGGQSSGVQTEIGTGDKASVNIGGQPSGAQTEGAQACKVVKM
ncbi:hypothetical protein RND71_013466 [Anisodus tanguticus]|uniref:DUF4283 domain-containing protein n=1 Tax=Anisodus tanguticus TaxID=243964 RepID=A0AAE1SAR7_9SOLA|nr:hypothetical protein RND71_013466 [Anisodus tanguticus]